MKPYSDLVRAAILCVNFNTTSGELWRKSVDKVSKKILTGVPKVLAAFPKKMLILFKLAG
jgi:hypothetical protein